MKHLLSLLLLLTATASADGLKPFIPAEPELQGFWWPVYIDARGTRQESIYGLPLGAYPSTTDGTPLSNIETVIYARALYKPRLKQVSSLEELIEDDQTLFRSKDPEVTITADPAIITAEGDRLISYSYTPKKSGTWERVTYSEEGEFYLLFTIRSQTRQRFEEDMESYINYIRKYRKALVASTRQVSRRREMLRKRGEARRSSHPASPPLAREEPIQP